MTKIMIWAVVVGIINSLLIVGFAYEDRIIAFEDRLIKAITVKIVKKLRASERFMKWLDEPSLSDRISNELNNVSIKILDDWRNEKYEDYFKGFHI